MSGSEVKTFVVGLVNGYNSSLDKLDELVKGLGCIAIQSVTDTLYPDIPNMGGNKYESHLVRVVVFQRLSQ